jgi:RNA polymerase sigma factor (sigma-70 family)
MERESITDSPAPPQSTTEPEPVTFEAIYDRHARWVGGTLRRLGVPERSCEDAMQEVFMVVHRRLPEYEPRDRLRGWLGAIALRVARKFQRRETPTMESLDEAKDTIEVEDERTAADELQRALDDLHPDQRSLLLSCYRDGVPIAEIAKHLDVPEATVKTRLRRAKAAFRAAWRRHQARDRHAETNVLPLFDPLTLFEADREPPLPDGVHERVWGNLQRALHGGGGGGGGRPTPGAGPVSTLVGALSAKVAVRVGTLVAFAVAGTFLAGLVVGMAWERSHAPVAPVPSRPDLRAVVPEPVAPAAATVVPSATPAPSATAPAVTASLAPSTGAASDVESSLMDKATGALAAGEPEVALAAVREHEARFHGGGLRAQQREVLWISALLRMGRTGEARERLARFERLYPKSPRIGPFRDALASP